MTHTQPFIVKDDKEFTFTFKFSKKQHEVKFSFRFGLDTSYSFNSKFDSVKLFETLRNMKLKLNVPDALNLLTIQNI